MSTEGEDERIARWERWALHDAAKHRRRMRWWRHMREYVSMKRLLVNRLVEWREPGVDTDYRIVSDPVADPVRCPRDADTPMDRTNWWSKPTATRRMA